MKGTRGRERKREMTENGMIDVKKTTQKTDEHTNRRYKKEVERSKREGKKTGSDRKLNNRGKESDVRNRGTDSYHYNPLGIVRPYCFFPLVIHA